jgi:hypothetical protein
MLSRLFLGAASLGYNYGCQCWHYDIFEGTPDLSAFRNAPELELGIRGIECDIRMPVGRRPWQLPGDQ